ncbi:hypothetical protein [Helicobacter bizzozeronii]|uniref:hypothetical protein n=1 Tax=Helicobacter bizzozeronii TaxID=56877 RepID=UPI00024E611A|nr:hypothetical protein [Helicobacter bizzozeronii]CCF79679.1 hypothetical protein HBZS_101270 [Helicobacter bizzozeronii CCUG 35545]
MKLRYYGSFTILFVLALGWCVYSVSPGSFALTWNKHAIHLPIALWVVLVVLVFFVCSLFFVLANYVGTCWARYQEGRDFEKIARQIIDQESKHTFSKENYYSPLFDKLSAILGRFSLQADLNTPKSGHEKVDQLFGIYQSIEQKQEVEMKKFELCAQNPFYLQNIRNKITQDLKYAYEVIKKDQFSLELKRDALVEIIKKGTPKEISKVLKQTQNLLDKSVLQVLLDAFWQQKVALDRAEVVGFCTAVGYSKQEYFKMALDSKAFLSPDDWFKFFELLAEKDELAEKGFLYVLLDLEMIEQVKERLSTHPKDEFLIIQAYLDLKKMDKNYPLEVFLC